MAHVALMRTVYKSGGRAARGRLQYITRDLERAQTPAARQLRYLREGREDLVYTNTRNLPGWAQGDACRYFQEAERSERAPGAQERYRGRAFEEWKILLPNMLGHAANMHLMRDLLDVIAGDLLPCTYAFHDPTSLSGTTQQPHLHLLISARQTDEHERTPSQHFRRYNARHPAQGGARKDPAFRHKGAVKAWRVTISDVLNVHLERAGLQDRVHPDSLHERGIDRKPEPKLLPSESQAYRDNGVVSATMAEVLTIRAERQQTRSQEQANAREYWEERKVALGITEDMALPAQLAVIGMARALVRDQAPTRTVAQRDAGVEQDARVLGDLAREAYTQTQAEAQTLWVGVQDLADAWQLGHMGQKSVQQARTLGRAIWRETQDEQRLRDVGSEAADDAWRDAVLLWAEEQGARALRDVGWDAVQDAREEGHEALAAAVHERWLAAQARTWTRLEEDLQALARQLDDLSSEEGGHGHVRIRLWEREREQGLGL
jgi:MobA/MobL family